MSPRSGSHARAIALSVSRRCICVRCSAQDLDLTNNSLVGTIPSSVGALALLTTLDLSGNAKITLFVGASLDLEKLGMEVGIAFAAITAVVLAILVPTIRRRRRRLVKISAMMVRVYAVKSVPAPCALGERFN